MSICFKCNQQTEGMQKKYGLHASCFMNWFDLPVCLDFYDLDPKNSSSGAKKLQLKKEKDTFFHGQYLKYSASLNDKNV